MEPQYYQLVTSFSLPLGNKGQTLLGPDIVYGAIHCFFRFGQSELFSRNDNSNV